MTKSLISIDTAKAILDQLPSTTQAAILALWDANRDAAQVHKAGAETITGAKTFAAKTTAASVDVTPLAPATDALLRLLAGKTWAMDADAAGALNVVNQTDGVTPFRITPTAVANALVILSSAISLGVNLDLAGHNLVNVGNVNVANGLLQLDGNGRIPSAQLTVDAMQWKGTWNASTNTPTLIDGTGSPGDVYRVTVGGTRNLGSGNITYDVGDWVILNSSSVWEKADMTDAVNSVAGLKGDVDAAALRTALSLVVGTNVQAQNANLQALAGLTSASDTLAYFTGSGAASVTTLTSLARTLLGGANAAAMRGTLGLGAAATMAGNVSVPVWYEIHAGYGQRAAGYMDNAMGFQAPANFVLGQVVYRGITPDASGSTTCELKINGTTAGQKLVSSANQWAYGTAVTATVGQVINAGDIIRPYLSAVGGTPGNGFSAVLIGAVSVTAT
ncbi:hypothetical protein [Mycolicibacterium mucogenicum]|uniref:Uncharacterized protein n=1 Tax=Mycolicibacterium mucogenicum DSM 44124 TaxID=1226753 RepID=A0A8E4R9D8_MYCMU|nr:hypothetical protein [Mycolicibacterium mucogenicum]QPG69975.1 hypothetical protein C1S78_002795 [Mycolicibacterium mucogenicum DSM 44124]